MCNCTHIRRRDREEGLLLDNAFFASAIRIL
jgi:hypothetical protein